MDLSLNFVGRQDERKKINAILINPKSQKRIAYLEGEGGIGKTQLLLQTLQELLKADVYLCPHVLEQEERKPLLIDFYSTDNRSIDGVRKTITNYLGKENFAEFEMSQKDTPEVFRKCLQALVEKKPVVLAFDTFELVHNDPLVAWLFDEKSGLQMPGLVCLIGSRPEEKNENDDEKIKTLLKPNPLVEWIEVLGISYDDALKFYCKETGEEIDNLSSESKNMIDGLVKKTNGNPLLIELVVDQYNRDIEGAEKFSRDFFEYSTIQDFERVLAKRFERTHIQSWTEKYLETMGVDDLKKAVMNDIKVKFASTGFLQVKNVYHLNVAEYKILLCMSYLTRRFDEEILQWLLDKNYISLSTDSDLEKIVDTLRQLFFVKIHKNGELTLRLHDEMTRLVRKYLFPDFGDEDISGEYRREFQKAIPILYDDLIQKEIENKSQPSAQNKINKTAQLQAERLYYMLEYGRTLWQEMKSLEGLEEAYSYFLELKSLNDESLHKLLSGEMLRVIGNFSKERQKNIYVNLAEIQQRLNNLSQAELYWEEAEKRTDDPREQVDILLKLHNMVWSRSVERSLNEILPRARQLAEKQAPELLPEVLYEFGFAYNKAQEVDEAIKYYSQASQKYDELQLDNRAHKATILNDLGFALMRKGEYQEALAKVGEGRVLRHTLRDEAKSKVDRLTGYLEAIPQDSEKRKELENQKKKYDDELRRANLRLGLAYSTEGQIARYHDELTTAMGRYDNALRLVRLTGHDNWIAITQNRRGETLRRLARDQHEKGNSAKRDKFIKEAHEAIDESIYLKKKYDLVLADMVERRKGRVYHDQAIWAIAEGKRDKAGKLLEQAREQFQSALDSARASENWQEVLDCEVELLFLQDDLVELQGVAHRSEDVQDALDKYKRVLDEIRGKEKIYSIEVFEYLWEIENGAYYHEVARQKGDDKDKYSQSLEHYVRGYVGMATSLGYGHARFKLHLDHLEQHIEDIEDNETAMQWCNRFLKEFRDVLHGQQDKAPVDEVRQFIGWLDGYKMSRNSTA